MVLRGLFLRLAAAAVLAAVKLSAAPQPVDFNVTVRVWGWAPGLTLNHVQVFETMYSSQLAYSGTQPTSSPYSYPWTMLRGYTERNYVVRAQVGTVYTTSSPFTLTYGSVNQIGTIDLYLWGSSAVNEFRIRDCTANNRNYPVTLVYYRAGDSTSPSLGSLVVPPGSTGCIDLGPYTNKFSINVFAELPSGDVEMVGVIADTNGNWSGNTGTITTTNQTGFQRVQVASAPVSNVVQWASGGTNLLTEQTGRQGFEQLKLAVVEGNREVVAAIGNGNASLVGLGSKLDQIRDGQTAAAASITNRLGDVVAGLDAVRSAITNQGEVPKTQGEAAAAVAGYQSQGNAAGASERAAYDSLAASMSTSPSTVEGAAGSAFVLTFRGYTIDANPANYPQVVSLAAGVKTFITWGVRALFLLGITGIMQAYLTQLGAVRQASAPNVAVLGNEFGAAFAIPLAIAITLALAGVSSFAVSYIGQHVGVLGENPFASFSGSALMYLVNLFIPVTVILTHIGLYLVWRIKFAGIWAGVTTAVRFLIGG